MCVFCFKQKTAYDVRISDGRSDVCSSDLEWVRLSPPLPAIRNLRPTEPLASNTSTSTPPARATSDAISPAGLPPTTARVLTRLLPRCGRSAQRRVGNECVRTCHTRLSLINRQKEIVTCTLHNNHTR